MIDTVILIVPENKYHIIKPEFFIPNAENLYKYGFMGNTFKNNFKTDDKYFPRLSITPRSNQKRLATTKDLKIEFSVTKLIYGNNLQELTIFDEPFVYPVLKERLKEMGVDLFCEPSDFEVSGFDVSKNIYLPYGSFCFQVIKELSKCAIDRRLDLDNKTYREDIGTTLQYYSNSHSFVVYDKKADLRKPPKRATDKDRNDLQNDLFDDLANQEIIRFEVRLRKKVKMHDTLKKLGFDVSHLTFKDLFNEQIWKRVLNLYWTSLIVDKNRFLFNLTKDNEDIISKIMTVDPPISPKSIFTHLGFYNIAQQKGLSDLRKIYENKMHGKNWSKLKKDLDLLNQMTDINDCFTWFRCIDEHLSFDKMISKDMN